MAKPFQSRQYTVLKLVHIVNKLVPVLLGHKVGRGCSRIARENYTDVVVYDPYSRDAQRD